MKYIWPLLFIITGIFLSHCGHEHDHERSAPYPTPLPDSVPITFMPGIISADSFDFNANFSPNGKSIYFSRRIKGKSHLYVTSHDGKIWGQPEMLPFCDTAFSQADPFTTTDGDLYYISDIKQGGGDTTADYNIWRVHPGENGKWSAPEIVEAVNSDSAEYYVSLADNMNLYFASNRVGGSGTLDIYVSRFENGHYTTPENLGPLVNAAENDYDPFISHDEKFLIFSSSKRKDGFGKGDLYYSEKGEDGKWSQSKNLGNKINTDSYDFCPYITRDLTYFFYSSNNDVKWMEAKYLLHSFELK